MGEDDIVDGTFPLMLEPDKAGTLGGQAVLGRAALEQGEGHLARRRAQGLAGIAAPSIPVGREGKDTERASREQHEPAILAVEAHPGFHPELVGQVREDLRAHVHQILVDVVDLDRIIRPQTLPQDLLGVLVPGLVDGYDVDILPIRDDRGGEPLGPPLGLAANLSETIGDRNH